MEAVIAALVIANSYHGSITTYGGPFEGQPLRCSTFERPLYYSDDTPKWIALPSSQLGVTWQCGDRIYVPGHGTYQALDSGPFAAHCVVYGDQCAPIVGDVPAIHAPFEGTSIQGRIVNLSAVARGWQERGRVSD